MSAAQQPGGPEWHDIATAPCDDTFAFVRWRSGIEEITDFDHDSDPAWWRARGATHWRTASAGELDLFWLLMEQRGAERPERTESTLQRMDKR